MDIRIGVAGPFTGPWTELGFKVFSGAVRAADKINEAGGVNGERIVVVKGDDAGSPKQAVAVANRLVDQDQVVAVLGHVTSDCTLMASEVYDEAGVLAVTSASTGDMVTGRGLSAMFRTLGGNGRQAKATADHIAARAAKRVVVVHDDSLYSQGLADAVTADLQRKNVAVALSTSIDPDSGDVTALVNQLKEAQADLVYFAGYYPVLAKLLQEAKQQALTCTFMTGDAGWGDSDLFTDGLADGLLVTLPPLFDQDAAGKAVADEYKKTATDEALKRSASLGAFVLPAYAAMQTIAAGFNGVKSNKGNDAANWLKANPVASVCGSLMFDTQGNLTDSVAPYHVYQVTKGLLSKTQDPTK